MGGKGTAQIARELSMNRLYFWSTCQPKLVPALSLGVRGINLKELGRISTGFLLTTSVWRHIAFLLVNRLPQV